jgi:hypothetical protein
VSSGSIRRTIGTRRDGLTRAIGMVAVGLALAACSGNPSLKVPIETLANTAAPSGPVPNKPGMVLIVRPNSKACDGHSGGVYQALVAWRITGSEPAPVTVHIRDETGPTFAQTDGVTGQARTGKWVSYGLSFYLVNAKGAVLASTLAPASPC